MRERPNRTVSKTVVPPGTVGSNPTPSAHLGGRGTLPPLEGQSAQVRLSHSGIAPHLIGPTVGDHPPEIEDDDAITPAGHEGHIVLHEHDAAVPLAPQAVDR